MSGSACAKALADIVFSDSFASCHWVKTFGKYYKYSHINRYLYPPKFSPQALNPPSRSTSIQASAV